MNVRKLWDVWEYGDIWYVRIPRGVRMFRYKKEAVEFSEKKTEV